MYPCPCNNSPSFWPPKVICTNGIFNASPIAFAIKVFPTPGGPDKPIALPELEGLHIHFPINSLIDSLHSIWPYTFSSNLFMTLSKNSLEVKL